MNTSKRPPRPVSPARRSVLTIALTMLAAVPSIADPAATSPATPPPVTAASPPASSDSCGGPQRLLATLNRPTVGYSACAVPKGSLVLEEGYQSTFQGGASPSVTAAFPQGFERAGVADRLEFDVIGPNFNRSRAGSAVTSGSSDLGLGFKFELPQGGRFTYAVDGLFTAATGSGGFGNGGPSETLDVDLSYALSPALDIGTTLAGASSAGSTPAGTARYGSFNPSVVVTVQIPNAYQLYAEVVGLTRTGPGAGGRAFTDFGLQKLLGPNLEVDVEYGIDFTPVQGSRYDYVGLGTGIRLK